jgi:hypothetical protein
MGEELQRAVLVVTARKQESRCVAAMTARGGRSLRMLVARAHHAVTRSAFGYLLVFALYSDADNDGALA